MNGYARLLREPFTRYARRRRTHIDALVFAYLTCNMGYEERTVRVAGGVLPLQPYELIAAPRRA